MKLDYTCSSCSRPQSYSAEPRAVAAFKEMRGADAKYVGRTRCGDCGTINRVGEDVTESAAPEAMVVETDIRAILET